MDNTYITIIVSLLGFLQTVFIFILGYIFKVQGTLFNKLDQAKKEYRDLLDKNSQQDKQDKADLEKKMTDLLDNHYVTTGQLSTLEQKLMGEINGLTSAINTLTKVIQEKL